MVNYIGFAIMQMRFKKKPNFLWKYWDIPVLLLGWFQIQGQRKGVELCHTMTLRLTKLEFLKYIFMFGFQEWVYDLFLFFVLQVSALQSI